MSVLNQSYKKDPGRVAGFPIYFAGEAYTFYLNFDVPINDPDFANFRFDLWDGNGLIAVAQNLAPLQQDLLGGGFYNIYAKWVMPDVKFGIYKFAIYDTVNAEVKCFSNFIQVEEPDEAPANAVIAYRDTIDQYGVRFESLPDFWMRVRMPLIQLSIRPEKNSKQYRNVSNRKLRNYRVYKDKVVKIESYYLRETTHDAMSAIYDHDTIWVEKTFVVPRNEYTIEDRQESIVSKGTIEAIVDEDQVRPQSLIDLISMGAEFERSEFSDEYN